MTADGRDQSDPVRPCRHHLRRILYTDAADGNNRQRDSLNDLFQEGNSGGGACICFGCGRINRPESDVVCSFREAFLGLLQGHSRSADDPGFPQQFTCQEDGEIILSQMNAVCVCGNRNVYSIVHDEGHTSVCTHLF